MTTRNFSPVGIGYHPDYIGATVWNRTGATVTPGCVVALDAHGGDAASSKAFTAATDSLPGGNAFPLSNAVALSAGSAPVSHIGALSGSVGAILGVVDDLLGGTGADDTLIHICLKGIVKVKFNNAAGSGEYGKMVIGVTGQNYAAVSTTTAGVKVCGRLLEDATTTSATTPSTCLWNGVEGWGIQSAT